MKFFPIKSSERIPPSLNWDHAIALPDLSFFRRPLADLYRIIVYRYNPRSSWLDRFAKKTQMKLDMLNRAHKLDDLKIPLNNKLEKLGGNLARKYSIRINAFRWEGEERNAPEVQTID